MPGTFLEIGEVNVAQGIWLVEYLRRWYNPFNRIACMARVPFARICLLVMADNVAIMLGRDQLCLAEEITVFSHKRSGRMRGGIV